MLNFDLAELEPKISLDIKGVKNKNFMPHCNLQYVKLWTTTSSTCLKPSYKSKYYNDDAQQTL